MNILFFLLTFIKKNNILIERARRNIMEHNDLLLQAVETGKEKMFRRKCSHLLKYYSKDILAYNMTHLDYLKVQFANNSLTYTDISNILIKHYYLCNKSHNHSMNDFNNALDNLDLEEAHGLLKTSPIVRQQVIESYLDNINKFNGHLVAEKINLYGYGKVSYDLGIIEQFY